MRFKQLNENKLIYLILALIIIFSIQVLSENSILSDQGTNAKYKNTLITKANLTIIITDETNTTIYNETYNSAIKNGSWNVMIGYNQNLTLEYGKKYYKTYYINNEKLNWTYNDVSVDKIPFISSYGKINSSIILNSDFTTNTQFSNLNQTIQTIGNWTKDKTEYNTTTQLKNLFDITYITNTITTLVNFYNKTDSDAKYLQLTDQRYNDTSTITQETTNRQNAINTIDNKYSTIGNWSADKNNYNTTNQLNTIYYSLNGGNIYGNVIIEGNLTIVGTQTSATSESMNITGDLNPNITNMFTIGNPSFIWKEIHGYINASYIQYAPWAQNTDLNQETINRQNTDNLLDNKINSIGNWTNDKIGYLQTNDQRYNDTTAINNEILARQTLGNWSAEKTSYNTTAQLNTLYNDTTKINTETTNRQNNDTNLQNQITNLNTTKIENGANITTNQICLSGNCRTNWQFTNNTGGFAPVGTVSSFAMTTCPTGWINANGSNVSRTTYNELYSSIGTTFGSGDGSTTFGLPDLRGEFIRGWDNSRGVDSGRAFGSNQSDATRSHGHVASATSTDAGHTHSVAGGYANGGTLGYYGGGYNTLTDGWSGGGTVYSGTSYSSISTSVTVNPSTAPTPNETRPRNLALLYCIKAVTTADAQATINSGTTGSIPYYATNGTQLTSTNLITINTTSGNIGIGTNNPQTKLEINGSINITGINAKLYFPDGTSMNTSFIGNGNGGGFAPVGTVSSFAMTTCPTGWLMADGSDISRTNYPELFSNIGIMYGNTTVTTFKLPDYRGYFLRGVSNGSTIDPDKNSRTNRGDGTTGDNVGTKQTNQTAIHLHSVDPPSTTSSTDGSHTHGVGGVGSVSYSGGGSNIPLTDGAAIVANTQYAGLHTHTTDISPFNSASTGGSETRPSNVYVLYCIKAVTTADAQATINSGITGSIPYYATNGTQLTSTNLITINTTNGNIGIGTTSPSEKVHINGSLRIDNSTGSAIIYVNSTSGNIGIGTNSPNAKLEVNGSVKMFGNPTTKNINTVYLALTDGFIIYSGHAPHNSQAWMYVYTDSNPNPSTTLQATMCSTDAGSNYVSMCTLTTPIKKGDYYNVATATGIQDYYYFMPIGQ